MKMLKVYAIIYLGFAAVAAVISIHKSSGGVHKTSGPVPVLVSADFVPDSQRAETTGPQESRPADDLNNTTSVPGGSVDGGKSVPQQSPKISHTEFSATAKAPTLSKKEIFNLLYDKPFATKSVRSKCNGKSHCSDKNYESN